MKLAEIALRHVIIIILACSAKADIGKGVSEQMNGFQNWKPSLVYERTDAVIIGERGAYFTTVIYKRGSELSGEGVIRRLAINDILYGNVSGADEVLFFHPPSTMHEYVGLLDGKAIFFLRKLSVSEKKRINSLIPQGQKRIAVEHELWTFATEQKQWMSYISISEKTQSCRLGVQLQRIANVETSNFAEYVKSLGELYEQVKQRADQPEANRDLDLFRRDILTKKRNGGAR